MRFFDFFNCTNHSSTSTVAASESVKKKTPKTMLKMPRKIPAYSHDDDSISPLSQATVSNISAFFPVEFVHILKEADTISEISDATDYQEADDKITITKNGADVSSIEIKRSTLNIIEKLKSQSTDNSDEAETRVISYSQSY